MKFWNLKKWDKVEIDENIYEFIKMDWMCWTWREEWMKYGEFSILYIDWELEKKWEYYVIKKYNKDSR